MALIHEQARMSCTDVDTERCSSSRQLLRNLRRRDAWRPVAQSLPGRLASPIPQTGTAETTNQLSAVDRRGAEIGSPLTVVCIDVVVVALKAQPTLP